MTKHNAEASLAHRIKLVGATMQEALRLQQQGAVEDAEALYREALRYEPQQPDALHMLGVICYQTGRLHEALALIRQALDLTHWSIVSMRHNLGLVLGQLFRHERRADPGPERARYCAWAADRRGERGIEAPLVSIVIPSYNHAAYIEACLESVFEQTYRRLELIIIDDGSRDDSVERIRRALQRCPVPHQFEARDNRGAHATINEAIARSRGDYINILNSDDAFAPTRIERMVAAVAQRGLSWGIGDVRLIDAEGADVDLAANPLARSLADLLEAARHDPTLGTAFFRANPAISTGNLFVARTLYDQLGGFRNLRYNHDWDFCLRALWWEEPVRLDGWTYSYRIHGHNTIAEGDRTAPQLEAQAMMAEAAVAATQAPPRNPFFPQPHRLVAELLANGYGQIFERHTFSLVEAAVARLEADAPTHAVHDPSAACAVAWTPPIPEVWQRAVAALPAHPLLSVVIPTYNSPVQWLARALDSVRAQVYPHWEICIADDASTQPEVLACLQAYAHADARIRFVVRAENGHISAATNSALALAQGTFVVLLDHDDELSPDALYWVAREIALCPDVEVIYSDEDKIDENGICSGPYLKPDWNPELLRAQNCISHLGVYRTQTVREVGGFRLGFEGAQDWDLALRVTERARAAQVRHIPRVLYHWRVISGSTAMGTAQKPYVVEAQQRALAEHHVRCGHQVRLNRLGDFWLTHPTDDGLPTMQGVLDVRALTAPQLAFLLQRWRSVVPPRARIDVLVRSDQRSMFIGVAAAEPHVVPTEVPAAQAWAPCIDRSTAALIALWHGHIVPMSPQFWSVLASYAQRADVGAVAPRVVTNDERVYYAGTILTRAGGILHPYRGAAVTEPGQSARARLPQNFQALDAGLMVVRRDALAAVGGLVPRAGDAASVAAYDIDACLRLRAAGLWNVWAPTAVAGLIALPPAVSSETVDGLKSVWPTAFAADPAHHPQLPQTGNPF